jgi:hypothetical protein
MYKRIDLGNNQIEIQEHFRSPMVYLDHWALNDLSLNTAYRDRFIKIMNERGGTLRLSVVNIVEISKQGDKNQVKSILDMIRDIEDCGLINMDPRDVIRKENALISNPSLIMAVKNPSAEIEIVAAYLVARNRPVRWHVADIISAAISQPPSKSMSESSTKFLTDMKRLLRKGRSDPAYRKKASERFKKLKLQGPKYQTATREIWVMAIDFVLKNKGMKMSNYSEWQDLFHVIVPVSYCDIVMIDKRWKTFISQTGFSYPKIAKVFDRRSLEHFFKTIERWDSINLS